MRDLPFENAPPHWKIERLDRLFRVVKEPAHLDDAPVSAFIDGVVTLRSNRPDAIIKGSGQEIGYKHLEKGDLVISGMNAHLGGLGISDSSGKCTPVYTILRKIVELDERYISYYLWHAAQTGYVKSLVNAVRYNSADFGPETVKKFQVLVPPIKEQIEIATYLDEKVLKIDRLIRNYQTELLLINQARNSYLTNLILGFPAKSPLKDIENPEKDLAKLIPSSWTLLPLKHLVNCDNTGIWGEEPGALDIDIPISTTAHLTRNNEFLYDAMPIRSLSLSDWHKYRCNPGDIIVVKSSGSADNIMSGKASLVTEGNPHFAFSNFLLRLRPKNLAMAPFLQTFLTSNITVERIKKMVSTTTYPNLKVEEYLNALIPVPPETEAGRISQEVLEYESTFSLLYSKSERQISNLLELKTSLISGSVTGVEAMNKHRSKV